ncbi:MAG: hypothetical protein ABSG53_22420 [Thermoguttaceae bacterium]|jgi:Mrp family chromosome partitioning ATPase
MSLMLNALKRIEAKQTRHRAREAAGPVEPVVSRSDAEPAKPIEPVALPPAAEAVVSPAAVEPSGPVASPTAVERAEPAEVPLALPANTLPESVWLDVTIDQLHAFVSEAGLLDDSEPKLDDAKFDDTEFGAADLGDAKFKADLGDAKVDTADRDDAEPPVVAPVASDPYAATAQQILRQLPRGRTQVLLFTSPDDGQGKTMTLAALAPRLAQGMVGNVLVVDANFRNPDMARCLAVAPAWRLPDVLAGATNWAMAVQISMHERVSVLPGGIDALGNGSSRNIQGVSKLLRELAGHYDLVLVDASSLAHRGTVQLSAVCDGTYLVVRLGEGSPRMLREAVQVIQSNGGRLMGCVAIGAGA